MIPLGITASASLHGHGSTTFVVDSYDEGNQASLVSFFLKAENAESLTLIDKVRSSDQTTISIGGNTQAGDIALLFNAATNNTATTLPVTVVPTGFTQIALTDINASNEFKTISSYRILDASDISSGTITGMDAEDISMVLYTFRPGSTPTVSFGSVNTVESNANPPSQTVDLSSVGDHPVIVGAFRYARTGAPISDLATMPNSSGFTFELPSDEQVVTTSRQGMRTAIYINNHGVYNELINTGVEDILLFNSFNVSGVADNSPFNTETQKTFLSPPNSTKFTISNNTFQGQAAGNTGVGNEESTSDIPVYVNMSKLDDSNPKFKAYNTTLRTINAAIVEPNIGAGTWHDYLTASYWDTLSVEFFFYLGNNSNVGSSFPRIFQWGDPNEMVSNSGANGFGFEFGGSADNSVDGFIYVDDTTTNRTQVIDASGLTTKEWYYVFMGVDKANGTCHGTFLGRNKRLVSTVTPTGGAAISSSWTPKNFPIKLGQRTDSRQYGVATSGTDNSGVCDFTVRMNDPHYSFKSTNGADHRSNLDFFLNTLTD